MKKHMDLGGSVTLPGTSMTLNRMGYDAMQLAGPQVWGPPRDVGSRHRNRLLQNSNRTIIESQMVENGVPFKRSPSGGTRDADFQQSPAWSRGGQSFPQVHSMGEPHIRKNEAETYRRGKTNLQLRDQAGSGFWSVQYNRLGPRRNTTSPPLDRVPDVNAALSSMVSKLSAQVRRGYARL